MLVVSRGNNDKIVFPSLGISVEILCIAGKKVRLGIDAPRDIPVHRHEVAAGARQFNESAVVPKRFDAKLGHSIRNRLHTASLGLHVLHRKLERDEASEAEADLLSIFHQLKAIEQELGGRPADIVACNSASGFHALVVEDDANERELLSGYLKMSGFRVDTAIDGLQAMVQLNKQQRPDVVLLDMKMPRFDGNKTISAIRRNPDYRGMKVFAVSGTDSSEAQVSIGEHGVDRWFSKPLDPRCLVGAIHDELRGECVPN